MINNRQGGRRRGRGGGGPRPNNAPSPGNRQDNRNRGNAAQLHEKYKAMARDAQLAGDRVQTEYYLQFADHYFRVLNENRSRFEEPRRQRDDFMSDEDEDQDEAANAAEVDEREEREEREEPREREERFERQPRGERRERFEANDRGDRPERNDRSDREQPQRNGDGRPRRERLRRERTDEAVEGSPDGESQERISLDVLPPAIAADSGADGDMAKAPRRRARRPRPDGEEIAPAA